MGHELLQHKNIYDMGFCPKKSFRDNSNANLRRVIFFRYILRESCFRFSVMVTNDSHFFCHNNDGHFCHRSRDY